MWKEVNSAVTKFMKNEVTVTSTNPVIQDLDTVCNMLTAAIITELARAKSSNGVKKPKQETKKTNPKNDPPKSVENKK